MLYKLGKSHDKFDSIEPLPFKGLPKEKELEDLLAKSLWDVLFEDNELMPISQESAWQPEADIYAINKLGELVIFELKRESADHGAVHQILRYCEKASQLGYEELQKKFRKYKNDPTLDLQKEHRENFDLEHPLEMSAFNKQQHLWIVGSAGDEQLIRNVNYWKSQGLSLDFIPYRVYEIGKEYYFEFFSLPYDQHSNPSDVKGVIFDTNLSWNPDSIWYMCENDRVAAFGGIKGVVHSFGKGDYVFLYHKGQGIIAAGKVKNDDVKEDEDNDALYLELKWLTPKPIKGVPFKAMPAPKIREVMNCNFYWAKTMKPPFLNKDESEKLLESLKPILS
jgi:hypothetical protein